MEKLRLYLRESYEELMHNVSWPTWATLQATTTLVLISALIVSILIFIMDLFSKQALGLIYKI